MIKSYLIICIIFNYLNLYQAQTEGGHKIVSLNGRIRDGVVQFSSNIYNEYAIETPRPYHLFLLFTASDPRFNCDMCRKVNPEFIVLAESYEAAKRSGYKPDDGKEVYFGLVEFNENQQPFGLHDFTSAPHLVYVNPDDAPKSHDELPKKIEIPENRKFSPYMRGSKAENMNDFVREKTGMQFSIQRSMVFTYVVLCVLILLGMIGVKVVLSNIEFFLEKLRRKRLWMLMSLMFYALSVSGMVYCIIREPPPYMQEGNGNIRFFHPAGRQQFVFEGLIVGGYDVAAALSIILLSEWAVFLKDSVRRHVAIVFFTFSFLLMYNLMVGAYTFKNQWYAHRSWF